MTRRRSKVGAKYKKGNALVIRTEHSKYSDVLKAMRSDVKLVNLGADARNIKGTRTGEMILELMRNNERKGAAYKSLAKKVLRERVEVRALTAEATLKEKNLDEITDAEEFITALR